MWYVALNTKLRIAGIRIVLNFIINNNAIQFVIKRNAWLEYNDKRF